MQSNKIIIALATVFTLTTTGCGAINNLVQSKVSDAKSTVVSAANAANATAGPEITKAVAAATKQVKPAGTSAPEATEAPSKSDSGFSVDNLDKNLNKLKSYREHVVYTFEGKDAKGNSSKGGLDLLQEVVVASNEQHIKMTRSGSRDAGKAYETFQVGGSMYIYNNTGGADSSCTSFSSSSNPSTDPTAMYSPRDFLGSLQNAKLVNKGENVNSIVADRYAASDKDLAMGLFTSAKADIWVAQDGGWVVKYVGEATGKSPLLGANTEGKITWDYNVEDANKIEKIALPPKCAASKPAEDIPVPDNVTDKGNLGNMVTFKSPDDIAKITEFYRTKLTAQGWKEAEGGLEGMMSFSKDNRTLTILISKEGSGGANVVITDATTQ
jgi:hypothetical protein